VIALEHHEALPPDRLANELRVHLRAHHHLRPPTGIRTRLERHKPIRRCKVELLVRIRETQSRIDPLRSELLHILVIYGDAGPPGTAGDQWRCLAVEMALVIEVAMGVKDAPRNERVQLATKQLTIRFEQCPCAHHFSPETEWSTDPRPS
jgi:hypothetical protein